MAKKEVIITEYDKIDDGDLDSLSELGVSEIPTFLAGNVAKTISSGFTSTYYSYDIYGRVKWVAISINGLSTAAKMIHYEYDPVTGLVNKVYYQKGKAEQFIHRYTYNQTDQLTKVETSTNNSLFTTHAEYFYDQAGTLVRTELADGAQGLDYVYNLSGQLKSINHPSLAPGQDPGGDTNDLFGMQLDYFTGDYQRTANANITTASQGQDQLNGNIKGIRWQTKDGGGQGQYAYYYDRNNWLKAADFAPQGNLEGGGGLLDHDESKDIYGNGQNQTLEAQVSYTLKPGFHAQRGSNVLVRINGGAGQILNGDYDVSQITYDANGNIQSLTRNKNTEGGSNRMDDLNYQYDPSKPNQLKSVTDNVGPISGDYDIDSQGNNNYVYNDIGQLIENKAEKITYFYNASGLVTEVKKDGNTLVKFRYNDRNQRTLKEDHRGSVVQYTYYVRDVAGQVMAIYKKDSPDIFATATLLERPIYGTGRVGVAYGSSTPSYIYELTDHLGNVRAVFKKETVAEGPEGVTDYYPGGMAMPGRRIKDANSYRYGYQGQFAETDEETGKVAFELRLYDPRINRWLSPDPAGQYHSPYMAMDNRWNMSTDPTGGCTDCKLCPADCMEAGVSSIPSGQSLDIVSLELVNYEITQLGLVTPGVGQESAYNAWKDYYHPDGFGDFQLLASQRSLANSVIDPNLGKKVIIGTLGVPLGIIGGAEFAAAGGINWIVSNAPKIISFSTKNAVRNMFVETGSQLISNGGDPTQLDVVDIGLSGVFSGVGSNVLGSVFDYRLDGTGGINDNLTSIAVDVVVGVAVDGVHSKIDGVLPDKLLSPSGEVYNAIFQSVSSGIINASVKQD